ncbi:MAG: hypothetical protein IJA95_07220 [Bacteroidaceae bacterium]|nr:hypothetical protein [Bacteroidaceae bacterium]
MKKKEKYLVYIHQEYIENLAKYYALETMEEKEEIRCRMIDTLYRYLYGETSKDVLAIDMFTNSKGEPTKGIEIYRLSNMAKVKNLKELKHLIDRQKKRGFVELKV